ncbi:hypothetical protein [uncultured Winogradskyella sp.]|uniref:hypothetical protein n=1 Tax=uncultured Winogradskyella sp. TaxID=395353 RepID=UPI002608919A|nr:hypothetical protein [uncultured Winogradskyella sp.]
MTRIIALILLTVLPISTLNAQVGIGTTNPDPSSQLHIQSSNSGLLIPRLTSAQRDAIAAPAVSLLIFNTDSNSFEYNSGTAAVPNWVLLSNSIIVSNDPNNQLNIGTDGGAFLQRTVHLGKFIINGSGNLTISGLPFRPSQIKFTAYANVESYDLNSDNGVGNNNTGIANAFGSMAGFASNTSGSILEQVIYGGGSGNSINDISRYASSTHCIGLRFSNQNGNSLGITSATLNSFNPNGFTLNVDSFADSIVVLYEAYR